MATITPTDPDLQLPAVLLLFFLIYLTHDLPLSFFYANLFRTTFTLILPLLIILVLAFRYITLTRAAALRLTLIKKQYVQVTRWRPVLQSGAVWCYFWFAILAGVYLHALLDDLPTNGGQVDMAQKVVERVMRFFVVLLWTGLVGCSVWLCVAIVGARQAFEFAFVNGNIKDEEVPLAAMIKEKVIGEEWTKIMKSGRKEFIEARRVKGKGGEKEEDGVFEVKATLAPEHEQYKVEAEGKAQDSVLTLTL